MIRLLALVVIVLGPVDAGRAQRPNVVLIIGDDQAFSDYGFMGHKVVQTPHLDALSRQGALFTRGSVPSSLCRPSLASISTGLWPHHHGVTGNDPQPGVDRGLVVERFARHTTLATRLGRHGYRSHQSGKWWEGSYRQGGFSHGMTHGDPKRGGRHGDVGLTIGREGLQPIYDFIEADDKPFFVWYAPFLPHTPHNPPARLLQKYLDRGLGKFVARYYAMCEWFDETCGELLGYLERKNLAQNTIVLFVADNGWIQRPDNGRYAARSKRSPFEGGVRTPIIVKWPGKIAPRVIDTPVSSLDLCPTILESCGVAIPDGLDGRSLLPLCRGEAQPLRPVFGAVFFHDIVDLDRPRRGLRARWVLDGKHKLIWPHARSARPQLFDVVADPFERHDLAPEAGERVRRMQGQIEAWWPVEADSRPNILVVVTDDQRHDMMGCAGHPILQTPTMNALAAQGMRFTNAFVTTAICAASRATILTGLSRRSHGYTFGTPALARRFTDRSYPRLLKSAGWQTGFVGKFGVRVTNGATRRMFDQYRPASHPYRQKQADGRVRHLTDLIAERAIGFLRSRKMDRPFCLSVSFHAPHAEDANPQQYLWPESVDQLYAGAVIPLPPHADHFAVLPKFLQASMGRIRWRWRFDTETKRVAMTRGYYRMITGVDRAMARIMTELGAQGVRQRTVVIFIGDNGYFLGERGLAGKWLMYEPSIRVPLIVCDPRPGAGPRGKTSAAMVLNLDLAATILDYAEVRLPAGIEGKSLLPLVRGEQEALRSWFRYEHLFANKDIPKSEGIRSGRYKYIRYFEQQPVYEELFDLQVDPHELENRLADPALAGVLTELRQRLD